MGNILSSYKKGVIEDIVNSISGNTARYYAFAANPVASSNGVAAVCKDDYSNIFGNNWYLLFGKRLANTDIAPVIRKIEWAANTVYTRYDNMANNLANSSYYVAVTPAIPGEPYHIYKCIDNANGANSTVAPDLQQASSFTKSDGYTWRYIYSISSANYSKFAVSDYMPVFANNTIVTNAKNYQGVEVVPVVNAGNGYISYHDGTIRTVVNSTLIEISANASTDNGFYVNNGIYIYNNLAATGQLRTVANYVANLTGKWVYLNEAANAAAITAGITLYKISPAVVFNTDGTDPKAYSIVNATSNTIESIVVIDTGAGITRADVTLQSNSVYGSGANIYAIVPPPGGHGADPAGELDVRGLCISFNFANSEANTIPTNILYNKIGLYKNPYGRHANTSKADPFVGATFNQLVRANVFPSTTFTNNTIVYGQTSGAKGIVAFSNSSQIYIAGDNLFTDNEVIISEDGTTSTEIDINNSGDIYTKDLYPIYTQNIDDATRASNQTESFKIIIQV